MTTYEFAPNLPLETVEGTDESGETKQLFNTPLESAYISFPGSTDVWFIAPGNDENGKAGIKMVNQNTHEKDFRTGILKIDGAGRGDCERPEISHEASTVRARRSKVHGGRVDLYIRKPADETAPVERHTFIETGVRIDTHPLQVIWNGLRYELGKHRAAASPHPVDL